MISKSFVKLEMHSVGRGIRPQWTNCSYNYCRIHSACAKWLYFHFWSKIWRHHHVPPPWFPIRHKNLRDSCTFKADIELLNICNSSHILQQYMPDRTTVNYNLRPRSHNKTLIPKTSDLNERNFLIRNLYKDCY